MRSHFISVLFAGTIAVTGCASSPDIRQSDSPLYASSYSINDRRIGSYDLNLIADAPQRKVVLVHFDRPASDIFMPLLTEVDRYDDTIADVSFDHSGSETPGQFGVGTIRICTFKSGKTLYEPLIVYEENAFYAYTVDQERSTRSLPIKDVVLFYSFENQPENTSLVTVRAHYNAPNPLMSPIINAAFGGALNATFQSAAEVFRGRLVRPED